MLTSGDVAPARPGPPGLRGPAGPPGPRRLAAPIQARQGRFDWPPRLLGPHIGHKLHKLLPCVGKRAIPGYRRRKIFFPWLTRGPLPEFQCCGPLAGSSEQKQIGIPMATNFEIRARAAMRVAVLLGCGKNIFRLPSPMWVLLMYLLCLSRPCELPLLSTLGDVARLVGAIGRGQQCG